MTSHDLRTPTIALGTWAWGDSGATGEGYFGSKYDRSTLETVADKAHDADFTLWDTAAVYGMGRAETVLGEVLGRYSRNDYRLSTKFTPQAAGSSDDPVTEMLEQSLMRLGANYVDLYWIHNPADVSRWTAQLIPLLNAGTVKHVGVSNHNLREIEFANQILGEAGFRVEAVQNHLSLLQRSSERAGILEHCRNQGIPFYAYMVLEQGALTGRYGPENPLPEGTDRAKAYNGILGQLKQLTAKLDSIGQKYGAGAAETAIAWAIAKGATPIIGVTKPEHIDGLVQARTMTLSDDEITELEALAATTDVDTSGWWEQEM